MVYLAITWPFSILTEPEGIYLWDQWDYQAEAPPGQEVALLSCKFWLRVSDVSTAWAELKFAWNCHML